MIRSPSDTASSTLWVMNSTVFLSRPRSAAALPAAASGSARRAPRTARPSAGSRDRWRTRARSTHAASCRRTAGADRRRANLREAGAVEVMADDVADLRCRPRGACAARRRRCRTPSSTGRSIRPGTPSRCPGWSGVAALDRRPRRRVGVSRPARIRSSVVLPQPLGPTIMKKVAGRRSRARRRRSRRPADGACERLVRSRTTIFGARALSRRVGSAIRLACALSSELRARRIVASCRVASAARGAGRVRAP